MAQNHSFPGTRETECAREHRVSPTEYKPSVSGNKQLSVKETRRSAHARAAVTFFRTLRIEHRRVQRLSSLPGKIRVKDCLCYSKC